MDFNDKADKTDKTDKTRFCIITAMKNSSSTIVRCANSVLSQLFRDFRWIVVDDHSTDNSWQKLESISKPLTTKSISKSFNLVSKGLMFSISLKN